MANKFNLKKERKEIIKRMPVLLFLWPLLSIVASAISGITFGLPNNKWYNFENSVFYFKIHIVFWVIFLASVIYRYITGITPIGIKLLFANLFALFLGGLALNLIYASLADWKWLIPLILMYPAVTILPFINQGMSAFLDKEIFAPKTKLGRALLWGLPAMGITGATLSQILQHIGNGVIGFAFIGLIFHFLLVWQTASFAQQIWKQYQKEKQDQLEIKDA